MIRTVLVALHPRGWRKRYGEEFRALLEDTRLTPTAVIDILRNCTAVQARAHFRALVVVAAALASAGCEFAARRTGLAVNILWAPTTPVRALALVGTVAPWLMLTVTTAVRRRAAKRA